MDGLIYAYNTPNSEAQRRYLEQRRAQLAAQRNKNTFLHKDEDASSEHIETTSTSSSRLGFHPAGSSSVPLRPSRKGSATASQTDMETLALTARAPPHQKHQHLHPPHKKSNIHRTMSEQQEHDLLSNPFELRHGRRYLRDLPYPLPCDLAEVQRQNLRTLLTITVFGKPLCNPRWETETPKKVLELGCGGGYWSAMTHDWFAARGHSDVEFVGIDVAPISSDLKKTGVNWKFLQYDMRRIPFPFEDGEFDLVMIKDLNLTMPVDTKSDKILEDLIRCLKPGGAIEFWDSDHVIRSLAPDVQPAPSRIPQEQEVAEQTATYSIAPGHGFVPTRNKHLEQANAWISDALDCRKLSAAPCTRIAESILMEPHLENVVARRVAIPFGELRWEQKGTRQVSSGHDSPMSVGPGDGKSLSPDQVALRQTALSTVLQMYESFEPMLRDVSGKNTEEWSLWRANMLAELTDPSRSALTGECLELGAWWATKRPQDDDDDDDV